MKKLITLFFVLAAFATIQAQNIPLVNGDCTTDAALTGISPFIIPGFTITQTASQLDLTTSGISGGKLRIKGAANSAKQGDVLVVTQMVDITSFSPTGVYTFQSTVTSTSGTVGTVNVNVKAYDMNRVLIPSANVFVGGTVTKLNSILINGTAVSHGASVTLQANSAGGNNAAYLTFELQVGKFIVNDLYLDDFTLTCGSTAATTTVTPLTGGILTCEAGTGPSAESTFTVEGAGLGAGIVVAPGTNLEVSTTSGSGFVANPGTITLPQVGGAVALTTIYTRLKAGITTAGVLGKGSVSVNITNPTAGKKTVVYTGSVTGIAASIPASDTLRFVSGTGPTLVQRIKLTAYKSTSDIVVTAGSNIELGDTLFSTVSQAITTLRNDTGTIVGTYIYARLKAGLPVGTYNDASTKLVITSAGYTNREQQFVGVVSEPNAVSTINSSNFKCIAANRSINVIGVEAGKQIEIFNNLGQKVKSVTATDNNNIALPTKGIYFIKVDAFVQKVVLK
ncbi:MAG: T9SS type A sorting domain-containing protein [Paludibacter sp.]